MAVLCNGRSVQWPSSQRPRARSPLPPPLPHDGLVPLSNVPLSNVPLSNVPLSNVPLSNVPLSNVPLSNGKEPAGWKRRFPFFYTPK